MKRFNLMALFFCIFAIPPVQAVYDLIAVDLTPQNGQTRFCLTLDTYQDISKLYLAATQDFQEFLFLSQDGNGALIITPWDGGEPPAWVLKGGAETCTPFFADSLLQQYTVLGGAGNSLNDLIQSGRYRTLFNGLPPAAAASAEWTIMLYMVGSNLEGRGGRLASRELEDILSGSAAAGMNILVSTGGAQRNGWNTVKRALLRNKQYYIVEDLGQQNMAAPETLAAFVQWGKSNYPARHYALVLWGESGGADFGLDTSTAGNNDSLSFADLGTAFSQIRGQSGNLDIVVYDTGFMSSLEAAQATQNATAVMVASAAAQGRDGVNYRHLLDNLGSVGDGLAFGQVLLSGLPADANMSVFNLAALQSFNQTFAVCASELRKNWLSSTYDTYTATGKALANHTVTMTGSGQTVFGLNGFLQTLSASFSQFNCYSQYNADIGGLIPYSSGISEIVTIADSSPASITGDINYVTGAEDLATAMNNYAGYLAQAGFIPDGTPADPFCLPGSIGCAPTLLTWLFLNKEETLGVDAYYTGTGGETLPVYLHRITYRAGSSLPAGTASGCLNDPLLTDKSNPYYCFTGQDACIYQLCTGTECRDLTVQAKQQNLSANIALNSLEARLSFCQTTPGDVWEVCAVQINGRDDKLYPGDSITTRLQQLQTGGAAPILTTTEQPPVNINTAPFLKRQCGSTGSTVYAGFFGYNKQTQFSKLCEDRQCSDSENILGFELQL